MKSLTLSAPSASQSIIHFFLKFFHYNFILLQLWNFEITGLLVVFIQNFAAYGLKFLDDIHWPVHTECLCINSNNTVICDALGNDKVEKSIANKCERDKGLGAGYERMAWGS